MYTGPASEKTTVHSQELESAGTVLRSHHWLRRTRGLIGSVRASGPRRYCVTLNLAGALATPPTVTITCCVPSGTLSGTVKLICVTPTDQDGTPTNRIPEVASTPPMLRVTGCTGFGIAFLVGVDPVATNGVTWPSPVMNSV